MELWIRSNDGVLLEKAQMVKVARVKGFNDASEDAEFGIVVNNDYSFGEFKTKERAIEVLDEIQNILQPKILRTPIVKEDIKPEYIYKHFVSEGSEVEVIQLNTYVYKIPKE